MVLNISTTEFLFLKTIILVGNANVGLFMRRLHCNACFKVRTQVLTSVLYMCFLASVLQDLDFIHMRS